MFSVYTLDQMHEWDIIVRSFADYDAYYLSGYVKAFQIHGDGEPLLFYYEDSNIRGINVVMKRDIGKDRKFKGKIEENRCFDFSTPYGYGGWLTEGTDITGLAKAYMKWCRENGIISEFVRFHPVLKNYRSVSSVYEVISLGETVTMDLASPEVIWANITSKNRNMIRKAQKNKVKIYNGRYPDIYRKFRVIYDQTMDKDHAEKYYYFGDVFYESLLNDFPWNAQVFYAEWEGKVIAASIMLMANGRMNYHLSGSVKEYAKLAPTNLLLYEAALWGCMNGCKTLYLGGGVGSGEDSLFRFKRAFYRGEQLNRFYIGRKVFDENQYQFLCRMRNTEKEKTEYFPAYRS